MKIHAVRVVSAFLMLSAAAQTPAPKFKAIWEPVSFNKDIELNAIACVGPETCWVVGPSQRSSSQRMGGKSGRCSLAAIPRPPTTP